MTDAPTVALNGHALHSLSLHVGEAGIWTAECRLTEAPELPTAPNAIKLTVARATLTGTMVESQPFGLARGLRVVGGAGGWAKTLRARAYHNDAGIKAQAIAEDAAREAGEALSLTFLPLRERVGVDFARRAAPASAALEYATGGAPWWVDYAGVTHVGPRPSSVIPGDAYNLLAYDPAGNVAMIAVDDLTAIVPGATLVDARLSGPLRVRDVELESTKGSPLRATLWCRGPVRADAGRLSDLMRSVVSRVAPAALHGVYRYRVVTMRGDLRCDLQAVRRDLGLPDLQAVSQCPGVPGLAAKLTEGVTVLVSFVDGDPAAPLVTHYAGPGMSGFSPTQIIIGDDAGQPAARQGDPVEVLLPPAQFAGTINGLAATGVVTWLAPKADGQVVGGSGKVRIA